MINCLKLKTPASSQTAPLAGAAMSERMIPSRVNQPTTLTITQRRKTARETPGS